MAWKPDDGVAAGHCHHLRGVVCADAAPAPLPGLAAPVHAWRRMLSQEFATLLGTGIPPLEGLTVLRQNASFALFAQPLASAIAMLAAGQPLSSALRSQPAAFDPQFVLVVESKEQAGQFEQALFDYAAYLDCSAALEARV